MVRTGAVAMVRSAEAAEADGDARRPTPDDDDVKAA